MNVTKNCSKALPRSVSGLVAHYNGLLFELRGMIRVRPADIDEPPPIGDLTKACLFMERRLEDWRRHMMPRPKVVATASDGGKTFKW